MAPKHAFAAKSPAQRAADIRPGEAWPATAVGWNKPASKLQLSVVHHESNTPVEAFHPDENMLGALCLFWAVAVETLPPLDIGTLQQRDVNFHWGTYQGAMTDLLAYLAAAPSDALHQLQQTAAAHVSPFGDFLRASSPDQFLMLLAGDESPKRPIDRVPLVHWLLTWQAAHRKKALRCQILPQAESRLPAPCPLTLQQWNAEISRHKPVLQYPGVLSRLALKRAELSGPPSSEPLWKRMLTQPSALASTTDFTTEIERFASTPDSHAEHVAQSIRILCTDSAIPDSALTTLRSVKSGRSLASAVKTVWYGSPTNLRPTLQANLLDLIATVEDIHGSSAIESHRLSALQSLDPLVDAAATHPSLVWSSAAATLLAARPPVVPPQATDLLLAVRDAVSFRVAVSVAIQGTTRPQQLDHLVSEVRTALQPTSGPAAAYAWFERRTPGPFPPLPHPGAPSPLPPSPLPSGAFPCPPATHPPAAPPPAPTGLLPPSLVDAPQIIRLRGLRHVPDATQASSALTHHIGAPVAIPAQALRDGSHFASIPNEQFRILFASAPSRTYVDPHSHYTITIDSRTAGGEPFFLPDSPVKPPPKKKLRNQPSRRKIALSDMAPPPSHPPPGFATSATSTSAPAASPQPPRRYGTLPLTRDAPQTSHRITPYHGSRVN